MSTQNLRLIVGGTKGAPSLSVFPNRPHRPLGESVPSFPSFPTVFTRTGRTFTRFHLRGVCATCRTLHILIPGACSLRGAEISEVWLLEAIGEWVETC